MPQPVSSRVTLTLSMPLGNLLTLSSAAKVSQLQKELGEAVTRAQRLEGEKASTESALKETQDAAAGKRFDLE